MGSYRWGTFFIADAIILSLTVYQSIRITRQVGRIPIVQRLRQDGAIYYLIVTIVNAISLSILLRESSSLPQDCQPRADVHFRASHRNDVSSTQSVRSRISCSIRLSELMILSLQIEQWRQSRPDEFDGVSSSSLAPLANSTRFAHLRPITSKLGTLPSYAGT